MILFTLDTKKSILTYIGVSIFLIIVNFVYSLFSHGVSSNYMTYMFLYPLIGVGINLLRIISKKAPIKKAFYISKTILNYGIATLAMGRFIKGVFEISDTDSNYLIYYFYIVIILIGSGLLVILYSLYNFNFNVEN